MTESETRAVARRWIAPARVRTGLLAAEWACVLAAVGLWASERPLQGVGLLGVALWQIRSMRWPATLTAYTRAMPAGYGRVLRDLPFL